MQIYVAQKRRKRTPLRGPSDYSRRTWPSSSTPARSIARTSVEDGSVADAFSTACINVLCGIAEKQLAISVAHHPPSSRQASSTRTCRASSCVERFGRNPKLHSANRPQRSARARSSAPASPMRSRTAAIANGLTAPATQLADQHRARQRPPVLARSSSANWPSSQGHPVLLDLRPRWSCRCPVRRCWRAPWPTPAAGRLRGRPCPAAREPSIRVALAARYSALLQRSDPVASDSRRVDLAVIPALTVGHQHARERSSGPSLPASCVSAARPVLRPASDSLPDAPSTSRLLARL